MNDSRLILGIESAIAGGSLALLDSSGPEIAAWVGEEKNVVRAEDLIVNIENLLTSARATKTDVGLLAVSAGPGSFTGIRIGIATALGLKDALAAAFSSMSALEAIALAAGSPDCTVAIPMGRNGICMQQFSEGHAVAEPTTMNEVEFLASTNASRDHFVLHGSLYNKIAPADGRVDFGVNVAAAIARSAMAQPGLIAKPLFISKAF